MPVFEMHGETSDLIGESGRALEGAVGNNDGADTSGDKTAGHALAGVSRAEDHDFPAVEVAKNLSGEIDRNRTNGGCAARDACLGADLLGNAECMLEKFVQVGICCAVSGGCAVGLLQLAQYLRLADHHGIQTACDPEQMPHAGQ
jgi:hypothetical protein